MNAPPATDAAQNYPAIFSEGERAMKRLPIIRHIRYFYQRYQVNKHYDMWGSVGMLPVHAHRDYEVLDQIWWGDI